ncbi:retrovirus-related pol polyprotein from transposon TNT 1-94 [Tanacetum coccineum]
MYPPPQQFTPVYAAPIHHQHHHTPVNPQQHPISPPPFISPSMTQQSQAEFPQLDSGLAVPMFQQGEDPIECINKAMAFLSAVASRFPPSNNQLRTSSNPRNQATIQDGRGNVAAGPSRVVKCYNCQGEGHMARQCTQPKRPRNAAWFKEKLIYDPEVLSKVPYSNSYPNDMINQDVQEMQYSEQTHVDDFKDNKIHSGSNIIPYSQYLQESQYAFKYAMIYVLYGEETLILEEESRSKMLDKQNDPISIEKKIKISPIDYSKLNKIKEDFGKHFVTQKELSAEQAFWLKHSSLSKTPNGHNTPEESKLLVNFLRNNSISNQSAPSFDQLFELNELKAQSQEKDMVIKKLKERIKSLSGKMDKDKIKQDLEEIETINIELDHRCNGCMLSDNHDLCVLDYINNVNARAKSKSAKKQRKRKVWKPIGKMFTTIRYIWRPTGRTFTIVGNACPLTRITTTTKAPLRKPVVLDNETSKPAVTLVYSWKPKNSKTNVPVSKSKVLQSVSANKKEPSKSWGSIISDVPSSSLNECRSSKLSSGIWTPAAPSI